jgi:sec-independent protein translocase protein TatA
MIGDILQPTHLLLILAVVLLVLGPKRLPEAGRSLGRGLRDFRDGLSGKEPETTVTGSESEPTGTAPE